MSASMTRWGKFAKRLLLYGILLDMLVGPKPKASAGTLENGNQTAKVVSVRKVLRDQYFGSRYPHTHYYLLYISLGFSDQTYCSEYETPVLDEIWDVSSAINQNVSVAVNGQSFLITAPKGHKLKAHMAKANQC
jgi:hypothetical protein